MELFGGFVVVRFVVVKLFGGFVVVKFVVELYW